MSEYSVSWCPRVVGGKWNGGECWDVVTQPVTPSGAHGVHASCPTREAAEAARRLLSGECERAALRETWCAAVDEAVFASGKEAGYAAGKADGAAQERARIVAFAKTYVKSPIRADVLAEMIERGEAGE